MFAFLLFATAVAWHNKGLPKPAAVDGTELEGFRIALAYAESPPPAKIPFKLENYVVGFEGHWTYLFMPKRGPKDKWKLDVETSVGPRFRIKVDPKSKKVISAVVE